MKQGGAMWFLFRIETAVLLCALRWCWPASAAEGPRLTTEPQGHVLFSNSSGSSISCTATGDPLPTVRWLTQDGDPAGDVPRLRHVRSDGTLVFLPFRPDQFRRDVHEARYRCAATNVIGTVLSGELHVTAVVDVDYDMRFPDRQVIAGNSVLLQCPIPSHVADYVQVTSWQRVDGYVITRNTHGDSYVMTTDGLLYIREARDADELRRYRCHTENTLTRRKKTSLNFVRLLLREPLTTQMPSILHRTNRVFTEPGKPADLLCIAEGFPVPTYRWFKRDGQRLATLEPSMRLRESGGVLQFRNPRADDGGTYVCVVSNELGEAQVDLRLIVGQKPWAEVSPSHVRAEVGHSAAFRCNSSIFDEDFDSDSMDPSSTASMEWRRNGIRLPGRGRVLHLSSIRRQDQGMYQCFIRSSVSSTRTVQAAAELIVGDQAPRLRTTFDDVTIRPGKSVVLRCSVVGDPAPHVTWHLDGSWSLEPHHGGRARVRTSSSTETGSGGTPEVVSTMTLASADVQDGGSYSCEASNYAGRVVHEARVNVYGPVFVRALGNVSALAGNNFRVQCPFGGYPYGHVYWEKDGRRLPLNQRQVAFSNGTLMIQATDKEHDEGQYTCTVHGPDSQLVQRTIALHVRSGPQITPFSFQANLHEGVRAGVTCLVHAGDPPIRIEWLWNGQVLRRGPDVSVMSPEGGFVSTLTLQRLSSKHNGNYTCRATNQYASASYSAQLLVKVPPSWTLEPNDTTAVTGRSVFIDCQAHGVPQPHIRWKSAADSDPSLVNTGESAAFRTIISNSHIHILVNGTLSIRSVEPKDAGLYLCEASNGVGSAISRVLQLTVRSAPQFARKFSTVSVKRGARAEVACRARGDLPMRFHWLKNNLAFNVLKEHRYSRMEDRVGDVTTSKITVQNVDRSDNAVFTCQASNEFGEDSTNIQLTVQDVPDAPANVEVREVSSRTVRVSWSPPFTGNSPITQYTIHWKTPDDLWQDTTTISGLESKATVRGLMPTTTYQLRVRADNVFGSGPYSESIDFTTVEEPPRFPPKNVQVKASNSRTLSISFDNPHLEDTGDKIEGYYVGYRELGSLEAFTFKTFEVVREAFQQSTLTYEVASLRRSTEYAVTVQAFNGKGAGPQSEVVRVRTLDFDPPNAPHLRIAGTTSRSISVNWENEHIQEAPVTGYYLYYKYDNGEWQEVSVPHDRRAFTLTDLRCGTEYLLHMRASNRAGKGAQGETVSVKTNGGRPLEPDSNKLFEVNSTFVVLHLEAWDDGGCPIAYFVVQYRADGGASDWTLHSNNVVPQQQLVHLGDLVPGSWYTLLMSAHNDAGSTEVELSFATLTLSGDMPSRRSDVLDPQVAFYRHLTVTLPIVSSALVLVVVLGVVCLVLRKRTYDTRQRSVDGIVVSECCDAGKGDMMLAVSHESQGRNQEAVYYPAPYSTHRGHPPRCNGGGGGPRFEDTKARTYDVPYPVKRVARNVGSKSRGINDVHAGVRTSRSGSDVQNVPLSHIEAKGHDDDSVEGRW
ncbi:cell adhesion molecule Dscam1-like isoform X2 [Ornithodoros turicata]|uniref:cell adhesion molecule Dscam1-like isoform X2 n=1 Tax=Ornithodoros turicata TaxID=34597 RepID=UPI003139CA33